MKCARNIGIVFLLIAAAARTQTLDNRSLNGRYFFRHIQLSPDANGAWGGARSMLGTMTFDGAGSLSFTGRQNINTAAAVPVSGSGTYAVTPAGLLTMTNPQQLGGTINARLGEGAVIGSSTEITDNAYDLLIAIAAPTAAVGSAALNTSYWAGTLEFPLGATSAVRSAFFKLSADGAGKFATFTLSGHASNQGHVPISQTVNGATYILSADGSGSAALPGASLLAADRNLYISRDGAFILGGSTAAGAHDILIGIRAPTNAQTAADWRDRYWTAGMRAGGRIEISVGAVSSNGAGKLLSARRIRGFGVGLVDYTGVTGYTLNADGSGTSQLSKAAIGAGGNAFLSAAVSAADPGAYELSFGVRMPPLSGTGVYINPQGIVNAAGFAPAGNPVAPGEFVTIYGSGLASATQVASAPPFPVSGLAGVTVLVNGLPAPVYAVSPGSISALIPFAATGTKATVVVNNNGTNSNAVDVPLTKTAPGIFALDSSGSGAAAVLHADFSVVKPESKAKRGETVLVFLTGLGAVSPPIADGAAAPASPLSRTSAPVTVYVGGVQLVASDIAYSGLAPGLPGLYQLNIRIPAAVIPGDAVPLAIETAEAFHDQVDIAVAP